MPLTEDESMIAKHTLILDEGLRQLPYFDCCGQFFRLCTCWPQGKLSIGVGRNLEDNGLSEKEAIELERADIETATVLIERHFPWFDKLTTPRRIVIVSMVYNLGLVGFKKFQKLIKNIESRDFRSAAKEMRVSLWAHQVKDRAIRLAEIMENGHF